MQTITLYTRDGREVTQVQIPHFALPVEILLWGERFFVRRDDGKYYEGVCWLVMN